MPSHYSAYVGCENGVRVEQNPTGTAIRAFVYAARRRAAIDPGINGPLMDRVERDGLHGGNGRSTRRRGGSSTRGCGHES